jgi:hypothetical protein
VKVAHEKRRKQMTIRQRATMPSLRTPPPMPMNAQPGEGQ